MDPLAFLGVQALEHEAWLDVVAELRAAGAGEINRGEPNERLHDAITAWGEKLAQLRMVDPNPDHARNAFQERELKYNEWEKIR